MSLTEFFDVRLKKVANIDKVDDEALARLEHEAEYSAQPLSFHTKIGGHLHSHRKFMTIEQIYKRRERVRSLFSKYR